MLKFLFNRKYRFFRKKVRAVETAIWELDFKVVKSRQIREGVRQDRERAVEALLRVTTQIGMEKDPEKIKDLESQKAEFEANVKRYEAQMKMIDDQINGVKASGDNPGEEGINDRISAMAELRQMYKQYLTTI